LTTISLTFTCIHCFFVSYPGYTEEKCMIPSPMWVGYEANLIFQFKLLTGMSLHSSYVYITHLWTVGLNFIQLWSTLLTACIHNYEGCSEIPVSGLT